jgi:heme exporter protein A
VGESLLSADSLSIERGGRLLLQDFSLRVEAGDLVYIEGDNGSGKTSLLRTLAGLSRYGYSGELRCRVPVLYLGHRPAIKGFLSPRENLEWYARAACSDPAEVAVALEAVGLYGYEDVPCRALSAGQQRRVNLARLQLSAEQLWLLDEPFTSIDKAGVAALQDTLAAQVERGGAIVMTSHQEVPLAESARRIHLGGGR